VISLTALPALMTSVAGQGSFVAGLQAAFFEVCNFKEMLMVSKTPSHGEWCTTLNIALAGGHWLANVDQLSNLD
jgi:hypothetical protein